MCRFWWRPAFRSRWAILRRTVSNSLPWRNCLKKSKIACGWRKSRMRCVMQPERGMVGMRVGWFHGHLPETVTIQATSDCSAILRRVSVCLNEMIAGKHAGLVEWVLAKVSSEAHSWRRTLLEEDIERIVNFFARDTLNPLQSSTPASSSMAAMVSSALPSSRLLT